MNCSLFVIFHSSLHEDQYRGKENAFIYAKVGEHPIRVSSPKILEGVIEHTKMPVVDRRGKHWAESEFLISLYKSLKERPSYIGDSKWVGFIQYDHTIRARTGIDLLDFLQENLGQIDNSAAICFAPINLKMEVSQNHIAMDPSDPQKLRGDPICYLQMISDYNEFYGTNHTYKDFLQNNETIALCSSFVITTENFMKMMEFCVWAAEKNDLNQYDIARKHRIAGGLMERYYGCWLALSAVKLTKFALDELPRM